MAGQLVAVAAFFVESQPGTPALLKIILYPKRDDRTNTGEGVAHPPEQGPLAAAIVVLEIGFL
jgi:hypothetical protein